MQLGHTPEDIFLPYALDERQVPVGPMTNVTTPEGGTTLFILGADSTLGRDAFLRLLYGARVSLEVALLSTLGVMFFGVILGSMAGYFRGGIDTLVSRLSEIVMAFPVLLFYIALGVHDRAAPEQPHVRRDLPARGTDARDHLRHLRLVLPARGSCVRRCCRCARRSSWRPRG